MEVVGDSEILKEQKTRKWQFFKKKKKSHTFHPSIQREKTEKKGKALSSRRVSFRNGNNKFKGFFSPKNTKYKQRGKVERVLAVLAEELGFGSQSLNGGSQLSVISPPDFCNRHIQAGRQSTYM